jgi:hypothetical protein
MPVPSKIRRHDMAKKISGKGSAHDENFGSKGRESLRGVE